MADSAPAYLCPYCHGPLELGSLQGGSYQALLPGLRWYPHQGGPHLGERLPPIRFPPPALSGGLCRNCRTVILRF